MHVIAAKAVCFLEALKPEFKEYQAQVRLNAVELAQSMINRGYYVVSGGTDNHLCLIDLRKNLPELTGSLAQKSLDKAHITLNKNTVPGEDRSPFKTSGIRMGTPAVTSRGMTEGDMPQIAEAIDTVLKDPKNPEAIEEARSIATRLASSYPLPY